MAPVYLDYNSTTPTDPRVVELMRHYALEDFGNPGSRHLPGNEARRAVEKARRQVATVLGVDPDEILFTSGATESNNIVLLGLAEFGRHTGRMHILASSIEHPSILRPLEVLGRDGFEVELLPVGSDGYVDPEDIRARIRRTTLLVSVMHANNETGVLQPVVEIAALVAKTCALFHVDAAQTFGKEIDGLRAISCDFLSLSAHKVLGPKGVGALYVRSRAGCRPILSPVMYGGGQEWGLRPGTLPVPLIAGLGLAAELASIEHAERNRNALTVRREFEMGLAEIDHVVNGDVNRMQSHVMNVSFPGIDSEALMLVLRDSIAISNGAACSSTTMRRSHVLTAMGFDPERFSSSVRFSWGPGVDRVPFDRLVHAIRSLAP
jgi:cysteine desulfurase